MSFHKKTDTGLSIKTNFFLGQKIYLITDIYQYPRIITAIIVRQTGLIYEVAFGELTSHHYDYELSDSEDLLLKQQFTGE